MVTTENRRCTGNTYSIMWGDRIYSKDRYKNESIKCTKDKHADEKIDDIDPILTASIYLDYGSIGRDPAYVADRMKTISNHMINLRKQYETKFGAIPNKSGKVTAGTFDKLLSIYENNQVYYQDKIEDGSISTEDAIKGLTDLECWFMMIIESKPKDKSEIEA